MYTQSLDTPTLFEFATFLVAYFNLVHSFDAPLDCQHLSDIY